MNQMDDRSDYIEAEFGIDHKFWLIAVGAAIASVVLWFCLTPTYVVDWWHPMYWW